VAKRNGEWETVEAKTLVIGDRIKIKLGDIIPADAVLGPGFCEVDQSALTGDPWPLPNSRETKSTKALYASEATWKL